VVRQPIGPQSVWYCDGCRKGNGRDRLQCPPGHTHCPLCCGFRPKEPDDDEHARGPATSGRDGRPLPAAGQQPARLYRPAAEAGVQDSEAAAQEIGRLADALAERQQQIVRVKALAETYREGSDHISQGIAHAIEEALKVPETSSASASEPEGSAGPTEKEQG
jgi:hypothetical protein